MVFPKKCVLWTERERKEREREKVRERVRERASKTLVFCDF